ncbi:conserved protein of unknown function [Candidatus Filomicrobium marinum]|uniref:Sulfotransferase family protein n=1 Tax=Candidatus Filomicrobium marinum TaxID=1608628 RepID=A0A0D6JIB5_9HYPH|nr:sulfotransferase [Candidatus Filomicrobium marinum]CFX36604.1 conserved protein of unknown function [Candidatus Filomicrobium marinum]CPR21719.1 conserved protein of unknown function [Candidatus Filomicrobium marinum]
MLNIIDRGRNILQQTLAPDEKIFFIGFNKCGTTSLHHLMTQHAIRSTHWNNGQLADDIEKLLSDKNNLKKYLSRATAYSDIIYSTHREQIEGNKHFRLFHELFPRAYFILNDRNLEAWVKSRSNHHNGSHLERCMAAWKTDERGVKTIWRQTYEAHTNDVLDYFNGHARFLHFRIDRDSINMLIDFLSPSFTLRARGWKITNATKQG